MEALVINAVTVVIHNLVGLEDVLNVENGTVWKKLYLIKMLYHRLEEEMF